LRCERRLDRNRLKLMPSVVGAPGSRCHPDREGRQSNHDRSHSNFFLGSANDYARISSFGEQLNVRFYYVVVPAVETIHQFGAAVVGDVLHGAIHSLPVPPNACHPPWRGWPSLIAVERVMKVGLRSVQLR